MTNQNVTTTEMFGPMSFATKFWLVLIISLTFPISVPLLATLVAYKILTAPQTRSR